MTHEAVGHTTRLWIDGVEQFTAGTPASSGTVGCEIGALAGTLTQAGEINYCRIYDQTLPGPTHSEMPTHSYEFNDNFGIVIEDSIGDSDGTLNNADDSKFWVFVPGLLDGSSAADGNPITLLPTHFCNNASRIVYDPWDAPELVDLDLPALSPVGELLRNVDPVNQKYRSETGIVFDGGVFLDGQPFRDGDDRIFNVPEAPIDQQLGLAILYIGRDQTLDTSAAWAGTSTHLIQANQS
jgi:hypothetical protein